MCLFPVVVNYTSLKENSIKILIKFHLKKWTLLIGMFWSVATASPDQWALVIGGPRVQALMKRGCPGRRPDTDPEAGAAPPTGPRGLLSIYSGEAEPVSRVFQDSLLWLVSLCFNSYKISVV